MSEITLDLVRTKQAELASMIESLLRKNQTTLHIPAVDILMSPGEWYAGPILNEDGSVKHHVIASKISDDALDFDATNARAKALGLSAPTRQESRLIVAHQYERLAGMSWFWTCEEHSNSADAWHCSLGNGNVLDDFRSSPGGALAVRRLIP